MSYDYKEKIVELLELVGDSDVVFLRRILISLTEYVKEKKKGEEH